MKKETKFFAATTSIAVLAGILPLYLNFAKEKELRDLVQRPPAATTKTLRKALQGATEVRIYKGLGDSYEPDYNTQVITLSQIKTQKPSLVIQGEELDKFIKCLHAEQGNKSFWKAFNETAIPSSLERCTALEFYRGSQWIADIRIGWSYGFRWWGPPEYKADAKMLRETRIYLDRIGVCERGY